MRAMFRNFLYFLAGKISRITKNYLKEENLRRAQGETRKWEKRFKEKESFQFSLSSNVKIQLYKDSVLSRHIFNGFEQQEINYLTSVLKKGDIFIDIGSNIGLFSLLASEIVGDTGMILSYEPSPSTFLRLKENIEINHFKNIEARNLGVSNQSGELMLHISQNGHDAWNSFAPSEDNKLEKVVMVPVTTLDKELENINKSQIKAVKIDVEGWEKYVLLGGKRFFKEYQPIVMVEFTEQNTFNAGYSIHEIYDLLELWGYQWFCFIDGELIPERKRIHYPYNNLVAIKNSG